VTKKAGRSRSLLREAGRYGSLVAAGACIFLGLVILMPWAGVTWNSNYQYLRLNAYIFSTPADLMLWVVAFAFSTIPYYASIKRDRGMLGDPLLTLSNLLLPLASTMIAIWSRDAAVAGLTISGFIVAYGLARRSFRLLRISSRDAFRIVASVTLTCLAGVSLFSFLTMAMGGEEALGSLTTAAALSGEILLNPWLRAMTLDLEFFFLLRPALPSLIIILAFVAILAVLSGTRIDPARLLTKSLGRRSCDLRYGNCSSSNSRLVLIVAAILVIGSVSVGAYVTLYPYLFGHVDGLLGSDTWYYLTILRDTRQPLEITTTSDRPLFTIFLLSMKWATGASAFSIVMYSPLVLSILLSLSSYALVRQGTKSALCASFAALLSTVSSATAIGLGAAILANWFALAVMNLFFALLLRAQMNRSFGATVLASVASVLVLLAHPYAWAASMAMVAIQGLGILLIVRSRPIEFKQNIIPLISVIALNALFLFLVSTQVEAVHQSLATGVSGALPVIKTINVTNLTTILESTIDYARNRLDATVMAVLSIIGIADASLLPRPFRRILGSMMIVPVIFTLLAPDISWTWRGLYLLPTYLGAALGARSVILRTNSPTVRSTHESILRFAFTSSLSGYIFLSCLAWTLRATLLLMESSIRVP